MFFFFSAASLDYKAHTPDSNNLTQVFFEFLCAYFLLLTPTYVALTRCLAAAEMNEKLDFAGLPIYGIFTGIL